jgi:sulfotransferase family protein
VSIFRNRKAFEVLRRVTTPLDAATNALRSKTSKQARRQLAIKDGEIAALRRELVRARGDGHLLGPAGVSAPVFFILGYQKSGTTWLMLMLDAHPEILCKGEGRFFGGDWRQKGLKLRDVQRPPSSLYNAMLDAEYLKLWIERSVWSRSADADEHLVNLTRMAIDYFLEGELLKTRKKMVGDKSPLLTSETVKDVGEIYPEAKVIHIIRDGRDAAVSAVHHTWNFGKPQKSNRASAKREIYRKNPHQLRKAGESIFAENHIRKLARDWGARVGRAIKDGPALLGTNYCEVRYEDLVKRSEEEVRRLLVFLGAEANEKTVRQCVSSASFKRLSGGRERGEEDSSSFFRKGIVGDWKNVFTEQDKLVFKEEAGELITKLGYEKDDTW